jgi:cytochrome c oxidase assembly factor CtaG
VTPPASSFTFEPAFAVAAVAAAAVYLRAARGRAVPGWRRAACIAGLVLMAAPLNSPLETIAVHYLLLGHLVQNALIADVAPPLVLLGLTPAMGTAVLRRLGPPGRVLNSPFTWPLWVVGWYATHLTRPYTYALEHPLALDAEHAFLIFIGVCFWWPVIVPVERRLTSGVAVLYLLGAFVAASFLGLAYTFIPRPLYPYYVAAPRLWGISAARDQNLGGVVMTAEQSAVFLTAVAFTLLRLLDEDDERASRQAAEALRREAARTRTAAGRQNSPPA